MRRKAVMPVSAPLQATQDVQNYKKAGEKRGGNDISTRTERIPGKKRGN